MIRSLLLAGAFAVTMLVTNVAQAQTPVVEADSINLCRYSSGSTCTDWWDDSPYTSFTGPHSCGTDCTYYRIDDENVRSLVHNGFSACFKVTANGWTIHSATRQYYTTSSTWSDVEGVLFCLVGPGGREISNITNRTYGSGERMTRVNITWKKWSSQLGDYIWYFTQTQIRMAL